MVLVSRLVISRDVDPSVWNLVFQLGATTPTTGQLLVVLRPGRPSLGLSRVQALESGSPRRKALAGPEVPGPASPTSPFPQTPYPCSHTTIGRVLLLRPSLELGFEPWVARCASRVPAIQFRHGQKPRSQHPSCLLSVQAVSLALGQRLIPAGSSTRRALRGRRRSWKLTTTRNSQLGQPEGGHSLLAIAR